jgi:tRNA G18 (ribose-2'-O)-methylase SpoU
MIPKKRDIRLLLDDIRSVHNVGSIFRTAETLGISRIYCVGTTPTPIDRFGRKRKDFAKVALGAEDTVAWDHVEEEITLTGNACDSTALIKRLKKEGFKIIALEQAEDSIDYKEVEFRAHSNGSNSKKILIILGNEVDGVSPKLLKLADVIAEIPLKGEKESLNVSVAAGVFLYRLLDL